jgi:ubiquitin C-terminal hydrolase
VGWRWEGPTSRWHKLARSAASDEDKPLPEDRLSQLSYIGITNPSNYCFFNSALQCLRFTPGLHSLLRGAEASKSSLASSLAELLVHMDTHQGDTLQHTDRKMTKFVERCSASFPELVNYRGYQQQQDAGDFCNNLLEVLMADTTSAAFEGAPVAGSLGSRELNDFVVQEWKDTHDSSPLSGLVQGQTLHISKCANCGLTEPSFADVFTMDQLHLAPVADRQTVELTELLSDASKGETMSGYTCEHCKAESTTEFASGHVRLPQTLIIRLNRGHFLPTGAPSRVTTSVDFPDRLNLREMGRMCPALITNDEPCDYTLFGAVFHAGASVNGGHYFSYVKQPGDEEWMQMNDCRVSRRGSPQELESQPGNGYGARAMLLFYARCPPGDV